MQPDGEDFQHTTVTQGVQRQEENEELKVHFNSLESTSAIGLHRTGMVCQSICRHVVSTCGDLLNYNKRSLTKYH